MTIKSSGTLAISDIVTEFGGTAPHGLSEYYSGGSNVPAGTKNAAGNVIPSAGAIKVSDFYGAAKQFIPPPADPAWYSGSYDTFTRPDGKHGVILKSSGSFGPASKVTATAVTEYLVIAGGGAGGQDVAGGGGAGGYLENRAATGLQITPGLAVTVGAGGVGNNSNGGDSIFQTVHAIGGGHGGYYNGPGSAGNGGSGGGASTTGGGSAGPGGSPVPGQGFRGGNARFSGGESVPGAGGGAGGPGGDADTPSQWQTGPGGPGKFSDITGTNIQRGGGGGVVQKNGSYSGGGGGGGNGGNPRGQDGAANTGSGGGGSRSTAGASGGSGVVILVFG